MDTTDTVEITANVVDGELTIDTTTWTDSDGRWDVISNPDGSLTDRITVGPWAEDEYDMGRADRGLAEAGFARVTEWEEDGANYWTAQVRRA